MKMNNAKVFKMEDGATVILYKCGDFEVCTKNGIEYFRDLNELTRWYPEYAKTVNEEL